MTHTIVRRRPGVTAMVVLSLVAAVLSVVDARPSAAAPSPTSSSITAYGDAPDLGPPGRMDLAAPLTGLASTSSGAGYWAVADDGGVFAFGDAPFHGSAGDIPLQEPIVAMTARPDDTGYWLIASDGGVFTYGTAAFAGSMGGQALNEPIVGAAATPTGEGYWLVASDGGIFSFGDARFHGSMGGQPLQSPVVAMAATPTGDGYWLFAGDGGVFTFGDARFHGAVGDGSLERPVVDVAVPEGGEGYWLATRDGHVLAFGLTEHPTPAESDTFSPVETPVVAIAASGEGGYWVAHGDPLPLDAADEGPAVAALQRRLESLGYWIGTIDGVFGDLTEQALYAFQKYEGLAVDGVYGDATRAALAEAEPPQARTTAGDVVEVDKSRQLLFVVRDGQTRWVFNTATGDEEPYTYDGTVYDAETPTGRFDVFRQIDDWRVSHLGRLYRPKYFTYTGIAIHGYTLVPPLPASHGCVRVSLPAMDFLWSEDLIPIGMDVWVYGSLPTG